MKMLDKNAYQEISGWIHRNARMLDLSLWNYYFEGGSREAVINAMAYYQNEDGGFGNGIEPDGWNRESSPYATMIAANILKTTGFMECEGAAHPMVWGIFRFLESGAHTNEEGWLFCIPSNDAYPRAPWWTYSEETNRTESMGITASLCAFVLRYGDRESALYQKSMEYAGTILNKAAASENFGEMGAGGVCELLGTVMECGLASSFPCDGLMEKMTAVVNKTIERDPEKWKCYTPRPSEFVWSPASPYYEENKEIVETELDYLIETRNPGGVWDITWTWFDLLEKYPKEFAISENWWKASKAIEKVGFLKSFGRVEE